VRLAACFVAFCITLWLTADNSGAVTVREFSKVLIFVLKSLRRSLAFCRPKTYNWETLIQNRFYFYSNPHNITSYVLEKQFTLGQFGKWEFFSTSISHHFLGFEGILLNSTKTTSHGTLYVIICIFFDLWFCLATHTCVIVHQYVSYLPGSCFHQWKRVECLCSRFRWLFEEAAGPDQSNLWLHLLGSVQEREYM